MMKRLRQKIEEAIEDNAKAMISNNGYRPSVPVRQELASINYSLATVLGWIELLEEGDWRV